MFQLMKRLNYHHLLYFWTVAKYGGLSRAAEELLLTRSTLSAQIHSLESTLGQQLMRRHGRQLKLTDTGRVVFEYCERMFAIGRELGEVVGDQKLQRPKQLRVGVADVIPRLMLGKLLRPLLVGQEAVRLVCREDHARTLLAELSIHNLDLVISDSPVGSSAHIRGHSHRLGASAVAIFGSKAMALKFKGNFPRSLDGAPFLLPGADSMLRSDLEKWFGSKGVRPKIVGEFDDRDMLEVFGQQEIGLFPAPMAIRRELAREHGAALVGLAGDVEEEYFAITIERNITHPSIQSLIEGAVEKVLA